MPPDRFERSVFINCPFDRAYRRLLEAIVFTVQACGLEPRCAQEAANSAENRLDRIAEIIGQCQYGIHDISRIEMTDGLPRFNMPLELGLDLGCRKYGKPHQRLKCLLILDRVEHQYDRTISDLSGQDIEAHHNKPTDCIRAIRRWIVRTSASTGGNIPGANLIVTHYRKFRRDLPAFCKELALDPKDLQFVELSRVIQIWRTHQAKY